MEIDEDQRRLKLLSLHRESMIHLFRDGQLITKGLPEGSTIMDFKYRAERGDYVFTIHNNAFKPVETGEEIPTIEIELLDTDLSRTTKIGTTQAEKLC